MKDHSISRTKISQEQMKLMSSIIQVIDMANFNPISWLLLIIGVLIFHKLAFLIWNEQNSILSTVDEKKKIENKLCFGNINIQHSTQRTGFSWYQISIVLLFSEHYRLPVPLGMIKKVQIFPMWI